MIKIFYEWHGDRFGASFESIEKVVDSWRWLVLRYPGVRIVDIKIIP